MALTKPRNVMKIGEVQQTHSLITYRSNLRTFFFNLSLIAKMCFSFICFGIKMSSNQSMMQLLLTSFMLFDFIRLKMFLIYLFLLFILDYLKKIYWLCFIYLCFYQSILFEFNQNQ